MQRFKDNKANEVALHKSHISNLAIVSEGNSHLIKDPLAYDRDFNRSNTWNLKDIETFLETYFNNPKNFLIIGRALPHKTYKELGYFYNALKKFFHFKSRMISCIQEVGNNIVTKEFMASMVRDIMIPIFQFRDRKAMKEGVIPILGKRVAKELDTFSIEELIEAYGVYSEARKNAPVFN